MEIENLQKIVKFFNEPENQLLQNEIENWRTASGENEKLYKEVQRIWFASGELKELPALDVETATNRLAERLQLSDRYRSNQSSFSFSWIARAAAVITIILVAWWSYVKLTDVHYLTLTTAQLPDSVRLSDGSKIFVDANTTLLYPEKIKGDERRVFLTRGNAFFKVSKNQSRPFIIDLGNSSVTVLGTSFNILLTEKEIEVSVREGKVRFELEAETSATLSQGEGIIYHRNTGTVDHIDVTNTNADAWLTRDLNFKDASLTEVLNSIEKMYKVNIKLEDSITNFKQFNAHFHGDNLQQVLEVLEATYPIRIQKDDSLLIIKSASK